MIKIEFWLKKPDTGQGSLEHITIGAPKIEKTVKPGWENRYVCEVYLSSSKLKKRPIYGINPVNALCLASEFTRTYLQNLVKQGYDISEVESREIWKLEKLSDNFLQEKINRIKSDKSISPEDKQKILEILKESFSKTIIGDQLKEAIDR